MPKIEVVGKGTYDVEAGKKLVLALEDNGVDILHRCGGVARCVTCRVEVLEGDAGSMNEHETEVRQQKGITDDSIRLSCQITVQGDLKLKPLMTVEGTGLDAGPRPQD